MKLSILLLFLLSNNILSSESVSQNIAATQLSTEENASMKFVIAKVLTEDQRKYLGNENAKKLVESILKTEFPKLRAEQFKESLLKSFSFGKSFFKIPPTNTLALSPKYSICSGVKILATESFIAAFSLVSLLIVDSSNLACSSAGKSAPNKALLNNKNNNNIDNFVFILISFFFLFLNSLTFIFD